jgi:hypothetical protein
MDDRVRQLEVKLQSLKHHCDALIAVDAFERWGAQHAEPAEVERYVELGRTSSLERDRLVTELTADVTALRASSPEVLAVWVEGHVTLLEELRACSAPGVSPQIDDEVKAWREVRVGLRAYVEPWATGLRVDPARRLELLGA